MLRDKRAHVASLETVPEPASREPAPGIHEPGDAAGSAVAALRSLPEDQRMVMALYYVDGYSQNDIAEFLEVPPSTVRVRLFRSRNRLKEAGLRTVAETIKSASLPGDFTDLVIRKASSEADLTNARKFMRYRSLYHSEDFTSPATADKAGIFVVGEEGSMESAGYFSEVPLLVGSTVLTCARTRDAGNEAWGVPDPALLPAYDAIFKLAEQKHIDLAVVHGSQYDHPFVGFVPSFYYPVVLLPCERSRTIRTLATIAQANDAQQQEARHAWLHDPYAPKIHPPMAPGEIFVVREGNETTGYVRTGGHLARSDAGDMANKRLDYTLVTDVTVRTREAALAVIKLAGDLTEQTGRDTISMMQSHMTLITQTMLGLGATYMLRRPCNLVSLGAQMVAIRDLIGLTRRLEGEFRSRFASSPARDAEAAFSFDLAGQTVGFRAEGGALKLVFDPQPIHRQLPRWVVTRLYVGYYSGREVLSMGPLPWDRSDGIVPDNLELDNTPLTLPAPEAALFSALFPELWPTAWPDMDVWAWILGEEHPQYYFSSRITLSDEDKAKVKRLRFPWLDY